MTDKTYSEYLLVPSVEYHDKFVCSLFMLRILDRMDLMKVEPSYKAGFHDDMLIIIDGNVYNEHMNEWFKRFGGRRDG